MRVRVQMLDGQECQARLVTSLFGLGEEAMTLEIEGPAPMQLPPPGAGLTLVEATPEERRALAAAGYTLPEAPRLPDRVLRQLDVCPAGQRLTLLIPASAGGWHGLGVDPVLLAGRPVRFATRAHLVLSRPLAIPMEVFLICDLRFVPSGLFGSLRAKTHPIHAGAPMVLPQRPGRLELRWSGVRGAPVQEGLLQFVLVCDGAYDPSRLIFQGPEKLDKVRISDLTIPRPEAPLVQAHELMGAG